MAKFNMEKFKEVLHYIINNCGHQDNVGKTVLYKLMYFSDFDFYELFETPMTGEIYTKFPRGPGPKHFKNAIIQLENEDKITEKRIDFKSGTYQYRYSSLKEPHLNILSSNELNVINNVLHRCSKMTAKKISNYSHEDLPWQATDMYKPIDYELVFYRTPKFSVREYNDS